MAAGTQHRGLSRIVRSSQSTGSNDPFDSSLRDGGTAGSRATALRRNSDSVPAELRERAEASGRRGPILETCEVLIAEGLESEGRADRETLLS